MKAYSIYFSPTGTTKKVVNSISSSFSSNKVIDLTYEQDVALSLDDSAVAIVAAPVYRGNIPIEVLERLKNIRGNKTPAIAVVVYGNRHYDHALQELSQVLAAQGFIPFAKATFIGEHSFSTDEFPIAVNRPDKKDLQIAEQFGEEVSDALESVNLEEISFTHGDIERKDPLRIPPVVDSAKCTQCGKCREVCPTGFDQAKCISCMACAKSCPVQARSFPKQEIIQKLFESCQERREPTVEILG